MKTKFLRIILFFLVILIIPAFTLFGEKESVSYNENRTLAEMPKLSFDTWKSRSFMNGLSDFFSDHFVCREGFIKLKNKADKLIGKDEIKGVFDLNGSLIQLFRNENPKITDRNIRTLNSLAEKAKDTPVYFVPVATAQEKYKSDLPAHLDTDDESEYIKYCSEKLDGVRLVDVNAAVLNEDYAFYRTDHHWTSNAAYAAYKALGSVLEYEPQELKAETLSDDFKGTLYSKTLDESIEADKIIRYGADSDAILTINGEAQPLYCKERLDEKDKYLYFLGGNYGVCTVTNPKADGKIMIIKDSYANCLVPLLAEHFGEITLLDTRYCSQKDIASLDLTQYDKIMVLFNVSGFSEERSFSLLDTLQ